MADHGDVERGLMRASLGPILSKTSDVTLAELKARMDQAPVTYRDAETRMRALQLPNCLRRDHEQYLRRRSPSRNARRRPGP